MLHLNSRTILAALWIMGGCASLSFAQPDPVPISGPEEPVTLTFCLASDSPVPGYNKAVVISPERIIYVAPTVYLAADILSSKADYKDNTGVLFLTMSDQAASQLGQTKRSQLAIFANGQFIAAPKLSTQSRTGELMLIGMLPGQVQRIERILNSITSVSPAGPMITLAPESTTVAPGGTLSVHAFLSGVQYLRGIQVALDIEGPAEGTVRVDDMTIDTDRPDYVFASAETVIGTDIHKSRLLGALYNGSASAMQSSYVGTFILKASDNARGSFYIKVREDSDTLLRDALGLPLGYNTGDPREVKVRVELTAQPQDAVRISP